jgi:hypothetical protein
MRYLLLLVVFLGGCYMAPRIVTPDKISYLLIEISESVPIEEHEFLYRKAAEKAELVGIKYMLYTDLIGSTRAEKLSNVRGVDGHLTAEILMYGPKVSVRNFGVYDRSKTYYNMPPGATGVDLSILDTVFNNMVTLKVF